ncbi:Clavaminate synthase-like protein [Aaosphaeria arxii CBS 175.79]|uniref:Clavaminate synthase-like protein n=1 Tax=Aaosphaeria arxii CBS 175.79 TaxID=1450172 RepID=A0A6A5Y4P1_9PLEO|nr:Clavaminate synthase-like protein [Aaosphaeria arxii CBS 175.79]KAF2019760.1 Clavaminate synthase-like protein [Aaosphaeria arxii CBS 175.79]
MYGLQRQAFLNAAKRGSGSTSFTRGLSISQSTIPLDGKPTSFSTILLRDACACPQCVHESTNQRLFSTADIPSDIQTESVDIDSSTGPVNIRWQSDIPSFKADHVTTIPLSKLRQLSTAGGPPRDSLPPRVLWSKEPLNLPDYEYGEYMKDDKVLYDLMNQLHEDGLAFVTDVPGKEESLATIATRIGPIKDTFYGYTWDVRTVPAAINAAYTSHDLGFHTDLLYFQQPPHIQFLHCVQSASTGGASVFVDGYKAAVDLFHSDMDAFDTLSTVPVNYHYNHPDANVYRTTKPVIDLRPLFIGEKRYTRLSEYIRDWNELSLRSGGEGWKDDMFIECMDKINWGPPFSAPFSSHAVSTHQDRVGEADLEELNDKVERWHEAATKYNALLQRPEAQYERKMKPGECVLFDNTRTLHSRRAFDMADVGKPRWLRGTYVDKDPFFSKFRVLQNKFE